MRAASLKQADVARACGVTQGHFSKVLRETVSLSSKMEASLSQWLRSGSDGDPERRDEASAIVRRLLRGSPARRAQVMHLLEAIADLSP